VTREDLDLIEQALKAWRNHTRARRYGGLGTEWKKVSQALEAFERIRAWIEQPQLTLPLRSNEDAKPLSV